MRGLLSKNKIDLAEIATDIKNPRLRDLAVDGDDCVVAEGEKSRMMVSALDLST